MDLDHLDKRYEQLYLDGYLSQCCYGIIEPDGTVPLDFQYKGAACHARWAWQNPTSRPYTFLWKPSTLSTNYYKDVISAGPLTEKIVVEPYYRNGEICGVIFQNPEKTPKFYLNNMTLMLRPIWEWQGANLHYAKIRSLGFSVRASMVLLTVTDEDSDFDDFDGTVLPGMNFIKHGTWVKNVSSVKRIIKGQPLSGGPVISDSLKGDMYCNQIWGLCGDDFTIKKLHTDIKESHKLPEWFTTMEGVYR